MGFVKPPTVRCGVYTIGQKKDATDFVNPRPVKIEAMMPKVRKANPQRAQ